MIKRSFLFWCRKEDGAAAIEFALVAVPFVMLVLAILEISVMFAANSIMLGATQDAVRAVRTGQVQVISDPDEADAFFREQICNHIPIRLVSCNDIQFSVRELTSFATADTTLTIDEDGNIADDSTNYGEDESVMLVQVLYYYPLLSPMMAVFFADSPNNTKLLTGTFVFQTEPYLVHHDGI